MSAFIKFVVPSFLLNFVPPGKTSVTSPALAAPTTALEQLPEETVHRLSPLAGLSAQFGFMAWKA